MSEIPADAWAAADVCCAEIEVNGDAATKYMREAIASAIMAERERCAKIADDLMAGEDYGAVAAAIRGAS